MEGFCEFKCFVYPTDICTEACENIRNMYTASTNQIADILHYNDKAE